MAKERKAKVYTIAELHQKHKKKGDFGTTMAEARIADHVPIMMQHHSEGISDELYATLNTNPFLFNYKTADTRVLSIEEFYIPVKKETKPFGGIFRDPDLKNSTKRRYLNRAFRNWKKDYETSKNKLLEKENDKVFVVGEVVVASVSIFSIISMFLLMIIIGFLLFQNGSVWNIMATSTNAIVTKIASGITNAYSTSWVVLVSQASFSIIIAALFYVLYHNSLIRDFKKMSKRSMSTYKILKARIEKELKRKYKRTRKYYIKKVGKFPHKYAPYPIDKTALGEISFEEVSEVADSYVKKAAFLKKNRGKLKALKFLFLLLVFGASLSPIGYTLYSIVRQFI